MTIYGFPNMLQITFDHSFAHFEISFNIIAPNDFQSIFSFACPLHLAFDQKWAMLNIDLARFSAYSSEVAIIYALNGMIV